ncbi:hypothetical protein M0805_007688 [Coniferiporia weirii]|nr:hypothetical protein M0805_007688 [Coniferiporia weirii]
MSPLLSDAQLQLQCLLDPDIDPSCGCLSSGGGPQMNTDISGPGVRISFYLQALFLACLSARSGSLDEITGALYTLIATNVAMAVTSFILGFKSEPEISLHDAIVVFYLLALSWASVFFSLPAYNRFVKSDKTLKYLSVLQSYILFAFALAILIKADSFGMTPPCNPNAVAVIFRPIPALRAGRIAASVLVVITIIIYSGLTISDYKPLVKRWIRLIKKKWKTIRKADAQPATSGPAAAPRDLNEAESGMTRTGPMATAEDGGDEKTTKRGAKNKSKNKSKNKNRKKGKEKSESINQTNEADENKYDLGISGNLIIEIIVIFILWALTVMNTELLIKWNNFEGGGGGSESWQFGQILPMFLIVIPLVNMIKAFLEYKFQRRVHRRRVHKKHTGHSRGEHAHAPHTSRYGTRMGGGSDSGASPFGGLGGGLDGMPFMPFFSGSPLHTTRPDGNMPTARISEHSIHTSASSQRSVSPRRVSLSSNSGSKDSSPSPSPSPSPGGRLSPGGFDDLADSYVDDDEHHDNNDKA